MTLSFQQQEEIEDFRFGLKTGFIAGIIFVLASLLLARFHLVSFCWLMIFACGWFFLWMINLNTPNGRTIAKGHLTAQFAIVFLGTFISFNVWQSLILTILSGIGLIVGSILPSRTKT